MNGELLMEATALKPHERKKQHYALKAFLWGAVIAAVFIVPCIIKDHGLFLYTGEYNVQVIPVYQLMSEAIKNGELGWNWYSDFGTSFVGGFSCYNLGSPFFWLMVLFPLGAIPYLLGPMTILKFGFSSLNAYLFLKRYTKDKNNAVIGSMIYAFSGFAVYGLAFHFIDVLVFFPLMLAALDLFVYENKRGRFAFMVFVCAVTNCWFFAAEIVFCLIYWIVRMAAKSYRTPAKDAVYIIFEGIMGAGVATFLLLPAFYHSLGNTLASDSAMTGWSYWVYESAYVYFRFIVSFFVPPELSGSNIYVTEYDSGAASAAAFLPLFGMAGVFVIVFNKRRNKWLRVFYAVCGVFMFVPVLNSSFRLFMETGYVHWFFMLLLVMSLGSVIALEDPSTKWKKAIGANLAGIILTAVIIGLTPNKTTNGYVEKTVIGLEGSSEYFWMYIAVAVINLVLCAVFVYLFKKKKTAFRRFGALITAAAVMTTMASSFVLSKKDGEENYDIVGMNMLNKGDSIGIDDIQDWRSDIVTLSNFTYKMYDSDSLETTDYPTIEENNEYIVDVITSGEDSVYFKNDENLTMFLRIPGFECLSDTSGGSTEKFFKGIGLERNGVSSYPLGMYGLRSLFSVKYMFSHEGSSVSFENDGETYMPGWKYLDTRNGYDIYENEYVLPMGLTYDRFISGMDFEDVPVQYRHIVMLDAYVAEDIDDMFECSALGMEQVTAADYDFTEEEYYRFCEDRLASACYEFSRDKNGFEAKIETGSDDEFVFFTVPYNSGWKAYVNGEKTEIFKADYGFMAVKVPADTNSTIRFNYHTPGIIYGGLASGLCLLLLVIYLAAVKVQAAPDGDDSENENINENSGNNEQNGSSDENPEDMSVFDIVKQTEEQTMMHVYSRVPVILERGYGATAYDYDSKRYIDFTSGIGVNALGFADGEWSEAVENQLLQVQHSSNIYYNMTQIQLAELLCMKTGFSKVFFANSGAEANEAAIKLARKYGSDKYGDSHTHIVTLKNSFHGRTITTLAATGQDAFHKYFMPFTEGFGYANANDIESVKNTVTDDTCAVMIELVQGEGGVNPLDREFVTELSKFCEKRDILLIVDEIQTGVGRTGKLYCYENYGITPDIITSAKALGGGLPLSACMCGEKLKDVMTVGSNGTTFGGNPVACAGALKIIEKVSEEDFLAEVREKGEYMRARISEMRGVKEVRGLGLMIGIVLEKDNAKEIINKCAENGLLVLTAKNLIRLLPPLNIDYFDIDEGLDILERTILETLDD